MNKRFQRNHSAELFSGKNGRRSKPRHYLSTIKSKIGNQISRSRSSREHTTNIADDVESVIDSNVCLRAVFNTAKDFIFIKDRSHRYIRVNRGMETLFGFNEADILGKSDFELFGLDHGIRIQKIDQRVISGETTEDFYSTPIRGKIKHFHTVKVPLQNSHGAIIGLFGIARDITEFVRMEDALRESEERYRSIVDCSHAGVLILNKNFDVIFANRQICKISGYTEKEIVKKDFINKFAPELHAIIADRSTHYGTASAASNHEFTVFRQCGEKRHVEITTNFFNDSEGDTLSLLQILDVTDKKRAEEALRSSEEKYRTLTQELPTYVCSYLPDSTLTYVNRSFCDAFEKPSEKLIGRRFLEFIPEKDRESFRKNYLCVSISEPTKTFEHEIIIPNGSIRWQHWTNRAFFDNNGRVTHFESVGEDITERKLIEESLHESEERYRTALEECNDGVSVIKEGRYFFVNKKLVEMMGYERKEDLLGKPFESFIHPDDYKRILEINERWIAGKNAPAKYEFRGIRKDGGSIFFEISTASINWEKTAVTLGFIRDMTEQKKIQDALKESEKQLANIIDFLPDATFAIDRKGTVISWNRAIEEMTGVSKQEMLGKSRYAYAVPFYGKARPILIDLVFNDVRDITELYDFIEKRGNRVVGETNLLISPDKTERRLWGIASPLVDSNGTIVGAIESIRDISSFKKMEITLRETEQRMANIIEFLPDPTFAIDEHKRVIAWNRAIEEMTCIPKKDMLGKGHYAYSIPFYGKPRPLLIDLVFRDREEINEKYHGLDKKNGKVVGEADVFVGAEKREKRLWGVASPLINSKGAVIGAIESIRDITSFKEMEKALREAEQRLADIIEFMPDATFAIDESGKVIAWNRAMEDMTGVIKKDIIGQEGFVHGKMLYGHARPTLADMVLHPKFEFEKEYTEFVRQPNRLLGEVYLNRIFGGKGAYIWAIASSLYDKSGNIIGAIESIRDISKNKVNEEKLRSSLERSRHQQIVVSSIAMSDSSASGDVEKLIGDLIEQASKAIDVERVSTWLFNESGNELRCIDLFEASSGRHSSGMVLTRHEFEPEFRDFERSNFIATSAPLHDPNLSGYVESYFKPLKITALLDAVIRGSGKILGVLCLEHVGQPHVWEQDEIAFACQLADHISIAILNRRRRMDEKALRQSEENYRSLVENSTDIVYSINPEGIITFISQKSCLWGYTSEEIIGNPFTDFVHPDDVNKIRHEFQTAMKAGVEFPSTFRMLTKKGNFRIVEDCGNIIRQGDEIIALQGILRDITDRKEAEEALKSSQERYQLLFETMMNGFILIEAVFDDKGYPVDFKLIEVNPAFEHLTGLNVSKILGQTVSEIIPGFEKYWMEIYQKVVLTREHFHFEQYSKTFGKFFEMFAFSPKQGQVAMLFSDSTPRKAMESALQESEERFKTLSNAAQEGIVLLKNYIIADCNDQLLKILGTKSRSALIGTSIMDFLPPKWRTVLKKRVIDKTDDPLEIEMIGKNGQKLWTRISIKETVYQRKIMRMIVIQDVTEQKLASENLNIINTQLQALASQLQSVREEEKKRVSRQIHDEVGQILTGIKIELNRLGIWMKDQRKDVSKKTIADKIFEIQHLSEEALEAVRQIGRELRPTIIDDLGLFPAIEWQLGNFQERSGIPCEFDNSVNSINFSTEISVSIFRILQEALTNIMRHSKARIAKVSLRKSRNYFMMDIMDDGIGFPNIAVNSSKSLGIIDMSERARQIGGIFTITGKTQKGTLVRLKIPLKGKKCD